MNLKHYVFTFVIMLYCLFLSSFSSAKAEDAIQSVSCFDCSIISRYDQKLSGAFHANQLQARIVFALNSDNSQKIKESDNSNSYLSIWLSPLLGLLGALVGGVGTTLLGNQLSKNKIHKKSVAEAYSSIKTILDEYEKKITNGNSSFVLETREFITKISDDSKENILWDNDISRHFTLKQLSKECSSILNKNTTAEKKKEALVSLIKNYKNTTMKRGVKYVDEWN